MTEEPSVSAAETARPGFRQAVREHGWLSAALFVLVVVLYWPSTGYEFVNWDDPWYVVNNEMIRNWSPGNLFKMATEPAVKNYAPLTMFSYLVDYTLWGESAGGFHFTNFLLHAINAVLVYLLVARLAGNRFVGWLTAALFAVHPVQIETVAWVSSRKGLLSATFIFLCLLRWLRTDRTPRDEGFGLLFLVLALLTKAIAVVVPPAILLYDVLIRRDRFGDALARQFIPGLIAAAFLFGTIASQTQMYGGVRGHMALGKLHILAVDTVILWQYVGMLVWPSDLCVLYDPPTSGIAPLVVLSVAGWGAVTAAACYYRRRFPEIPFCLLTALVFLLPVLNLTPITTLMNDRYLYLPCIPLFALFAAGADRVVRRAFVARRETALETGLVRRGLLTAAGVVVVALLAVGTRERLPVWRNATALWEDAASKQPQMPVVQYQLATGLYAAGEQERAIAVLDNVIATGNPDAADRKRMQKKLDAWRDEEGDESEAELARLVDSLGPQLEAVELQAVMSGPDDGCNAFVTVQAGEGGTDSSDWAEMLFRMYLRWAERRRFKTEIVERSDAEIAGIRNATVAIRGPYAYGYLKGETGNHRLIRISPFDTAGRRHTSFAAVDVTPEVGDDAEIDIDWDKEVREDTYRAGGAGGQHVNKTDSAIRLTHLESNTVVQCQNERSQHKNRATARKMMIAKLRRIEEEKRDAEIAERRGQKSKIGFGGETVRNYVLHPDQYVKDARTGHKSGNPTNVLDGDIDDFIEGFLRWDIGSE
eukprot:g12546.t1